MMAISKTPKHRTPAHRNRGFALIVTLSLLILIVILALGLLSLSSITLRSSSQDKAQADARANARMALMLAIGELQRELGPDQRVNAPASILSDDGGITTSAMPGRRHWISAHDSWDSTSEDYRPSSAFRKWLVSGPDTLTRDPNAPTTEAPGDVVLWSSMANDPNRVAVPKIPILDETPSRQTGAYAWWVGDENAKALVSRLPRDLGNPALTRADAQSAPTSAYHRAAALTQPNGQPGIDRTSPDLDKLVSHNTLDLVAPNVSHPADKNFHDFTEWSMGVLTDVARGGLKRDLSLYLDHPISEPLAPMLPAREPERERLYQDGITWEELWLYHNIWRALQVWDSSQPPYNQLESKTGGNLESSVVLMTPPGARDDSIAAFRADPFAIYKVPVSLRFQWLVSLWAKEKEGINPREYDLHYVGDTIFTYWNPMDVPIALHPESVISHKLWALPYTFRLYNQDGLVRSFIFRQALSGASHDINSMSMGTGPIHGQGGRTGTPDPVVLMPGEVIIMSQEASGDEPVPWSGNASSATRPLIALQAGWNWGAGRHGRTINPTSITITDSTELRFEAVANTTVSSSGARVLTIQKFYGPDARGNPPRFYENLQGRMLSLPSGQRATHYPEVFPTPLEGELPEIRTMTGTGKHPFFLFTYQTKSEDSPTAWSRIYNSRNTNANPMNLQDPSLTISGHEIKVEALDGERDIKLPQLSTNHINRGLFGGSYWDHERGVDTVAVQSIPREPPLSLGTFQHAIASGLTARMDGGQALRPPMPVPQSEVSHAISNSYAPPMILSDQTRSGNFIDHSYHVNRMLWDSWFLSSIVQRQAPHHAEKKTARVVYQDFLTDPVGKHLPNRRMKPTADAIAGGPDELFDDSFEAHELASSKLMIEGAFNVNSTSVEAWKAILGSMEGIHIPVATSTNNPGSAEPHVASGAPVHGLLTAYGSGANRNNASFDGNDTGNAGAPAQWRGYRSLTPSEIQDLATALAEEIRARGPSLSMADFINRRLDGSTDHALCGPLQAALDRTVNETLLAATNRVGSNPAGVFVNNEAAELPKSMVAPLHVKQADILTSIGPQLAARSDTFRIRTYGESLDANGKVLAKAWCEAVVQRLPHYVDAADAPEAAAPPDPDPEPRTVPAITSDANRDFGRRIEVRSFRWLSSKEISS